MSHRISLTTKPGAPSPKTTNRPAAAPVLILFVKMVFVWVTERVNERVNERDRDKTHFLRFSLQHIQKSCQWIMKTLHGLMQAISRVQKRLVDVVLPKADLQTAPFLQRRHNSDQHINRGGLWILFFSRRTRGGESVGVVSSLITLPHTCETHWCAWMKMSKGSKITLERWVLQTSKRFPQV